jgi:hypothetical protein
MPGFDGTGPRGMGPMTGGGRGFCSPWGIGAAMRTGAVPPYRVPYGSSMGSYPYGYGAYRPPYSYPYGGPTPTSGASTFSPGMAPQDELKYLKDQANVIRRELSEIDSRIQELEPGI